MREGPSTCPTNVAPVFRDCTFQYNGASAAGAVASYGCDPVFVDCLFERNAAVHAAGGYIVRGLRTAFLNCRFLRNSAAGQAGALYLLGDGMRATVGNCVFSGNSAWLRAGGLLISGDEVEVRVVNSSFSGNAGDNGTGGIYLGQGAHAEVVNTILWGNTTYGVSEEWTQLGSSDASLSVDYSCVEGWTGGLGGVGNTGAEPLWEDALGPDGVVGTRDDSSEACFRITVHRCGRQHGLADGWGGYGR